MGKITFIGDIHSATDDLKALLRDPVIADNQIVFIGDYIDGQVKRQFTDHTETNRLDPLGVLDILMDRVQHHGDVALMGNHDELWVKTAKGNAAAYQMWCTKSRHLLGTELDLRCDDFADLVTALNQKPLRRYTRFLEELPLTWENDAIFAVHAGLNWQRPLKHQRKKDLLDIRGGYFYQAAGQNGKWHHNDLGKVLVTGHTPAQHMCNNHRGYLKMQAGTSDVPRYLINSGSRSKLYDSGIFALTLTSSGKVVQKKRAIKGQLYDGDQKVTEEMVSAALSHC